MKKDELFFMYVPEFLEREKLELKSDRTIQTYKDGIGSFKNYLTKTLGKNIEKITFKDINDELIRRYLKSLTDSGNKLSTRNIKLISLKEYIRFCADKDIELLSLQLKVSKIKTKKVIPKKHNWISRSQIDLLLSQPAQNKTGIRDRFIILFIFSVGARLSEALECRLKDIHIDCEEPYVLITGKGNKQRVVPLTEETVKNIRSYIHSFHRSSDQNDYLIYISRYGEKHRMSDDNVQRIINKYAAMARKEDDTFPSLHPHMLRHSFGAIMYRNNMSKAEIAKLMGHEQESTTEIYVETDAEMIRQAILEANQDQPEDKYQTLSYEEKLKLKGS